MRDEFLKAVENCGEVIAGLIMAKGEVHIDPSPIPLESSTELLDLNGVAYSVVTGKGKLAFFMPNHSAKSFSSKILGVEVEELDSDSLDALKEFFNQFFGVVSLNLCKFSSDYKITKYDMINSVRFGDLVGFGFEVVFNLELVAEDHRYNAYLLADRDFWETLTIKDFALEQSFVATSVYDVPRESRGEHKIDHSKLDMILDVELPLYVRLGKTRMKIKDILKLAPGSIIELDRSVDDYVELVVNGKTVALGDVVVVESNFGFRIKEIISKYERISNLKG